ncbi:MAG: hypothetical protein GXP54_02065 [Deltaproteobacteria bacterium]|nr:hypothetical protein [Deltaproteobacteria bacterium]
MKLHPIWRTFVTAMFLGVLFALGCSSDSGGPADPGQVTDPGPGDVAQVDATADPGPVLDTGAEPDVPIGDVSGGLSTHSSPLEGDPCTPPTSEIVITEFMANPDVVSDAYGEWIELHNPGASDVDITGWVLAESGANKHQFTSANTLPVPGPLVVPAGGYVLLCRNGDPLLNGGLACDYQYSNYVLTNTGDEIILFDGDPGPSWPPDADPAVSMIDAIIFTGTVPSGASVALRHPFLETEDPPNTLVMPASPNDPNSWVGMNYGVSTTSYDPNNEGTPGAKNVDVWSEQEVAECSDGNICTHDLCEAGACKNPFIADCCLGDGDCDDGKDCTTDTCDVPNNHCIYTDIPNCCVTNADCLDANPCNSDYCDYKGQCRHSQYNIVPGCCWAPADINPLTQQPWTGPEEKQAYADSQCDDKNKCTDPDFCDTDNNICKSGPSVPGCCTVNADCVPPTGPMPCTFYACTNNTCITTDMGTNGDCCAMPDDLNYNPAIHSADIMCDDNDPCTTELCFSHTCRSIFDASNCCPDDQWCKVYEDDNNACTIEKCVDVPATGGSECQHFYQALCSQSLPYIEHFDGSSSFQEVGWKITDYGSNALAHWIFGTSGELGPDEHVTFQWNPTTQLVKSVAVTPVIDASSAGTSGSNPLQATTVQWRMSYKHSVPGEPVTLTVIASSDGDYENGNVIWQQTLTSDLEYDLYSYQLDNSLKFASTLQIGFMVDTGAASTFNMDNWQFDDVVVAEGVSQKLLKTKLYQCQTDSCNLPVQGVLKAESVGSVPDLTMVVNEHYRYVMCYQDLDYDAENAKYWGRPHAYLEPAPLDHPGFVTPLDVSGFGNSCSALSASVYNMCGPDATYFCTIDVNPGGIDSNQGIYRVGVLGQDEWNQDESKLTHSPFQSLHKTTISVLLPDGYLVWSPLGLLDPSALAIRDALVAAGRKAQILTKLDLISDLSQYDGIFGVLGVYGRYHEVTPTEATTLKTFLDTGIKNIADPGDPPLYKGGRLYLEGGEFWKTGFSQSDTVLHTQNYFKIDGVSDGSSKLDGPLEGRHFWYGLDYSYSQSPLFNSWIDRIKHTAGEGGREVQKNGGALSFATAVSYEHCGPSSTCWDLNANRVCDIATEDVNTDGNCDYLDCNCGSTYRTIGASDLFGGLVEKGTGTVDELMGKILYFFENGYPPCTVDAECDDNEVCTSDTCQAGGECLNMPIADCVPCKNDEIQEDGSPSCGPDQACWVEKGYCVNIQCLDEGGGMADCLPSGTPVTVADSGQVPRNFGAHPQIVDVTATSTQPGWIRDLQVKVKVTHFYRGDVKLSLQAPDGTTVQLKKSNLADSDQNVYVTYDIGAPVDCDTPPCDTLSALNGKVLVGAWKLIAEDVNPLIFNGMIEDWKLYASYESPECTPATVVADCGDSNACTTDECINYFCNWTQKDCDDGNDCTLDACDPVTGDCSHTPLPGAGCGCTVHADCPGDEVCLNDSDGQVCSTPPCTCHLICDTDVYGADCGTYNDTGYPVSIPDGSGTVTRVRTISGVQGVVRQLWVKVVTDHSHIGDLTADLCNGTACVKLHHLSGGAESGFYRIYDYDPIDDSSATLADFDKLPVDGDWTLKVSDNIHNLEAGTLDAYSIYILKTDCYEDSDCDDGNPCTQDSCQVSGDTGTCQHVTMECEPSADPCKAKQCNPASGVCEETSQPDGTTCDDGLFCTTDDECVSGVCTGGPARDCSYLDANCVKGWCDENVSSCVPIVLKDGVDPGLGSGFDCLTGPCTCDAGEPCLGGDYCNASGNCVQGSQQICPCTKESDCIDDGDKCNGILGCDLAAGFCDNIQPEVDCDATNPPLPECQVYQCIPLTGACIQKDAMNFQPCEDGLYCTVSDYCETGVCKSDTARDCSGLDEECKDGVCDDVADACVGQNKADDTLCELDGLGCTIDWCKSGTCEKKENVDCTGEVGDICNNGLCDNLGWGGYDCVQVPKPDGFPCDDDSDPCTDDVCQSSTCAHKQVENCTGPCGGSHAFDAGDGMCGYEDSCVDGINGYPNGTCTPTCDAPNCVSAASGIVDLPIDESVGCTVDKLTVSSPFNFVDGIEIKADVVHSFLADLTVQVVDPQGYSHIMWDHIGGSNADFFNTFDLSLPVPYTGIPDSGVPMCSLRGEDASGDWYLRICDTGTGNGGYLHEWKIYVKGSDATDLNQGHRWNDAIDLGNLDINPATVFSGTTECSVNSADSNCGGGTGPDRLYKFTITVPKRVTLVLQQGFGQDMIAFIKSEDCMTGAGPCTPGTEELCANIFPAGVDNEVIDNQLQPGVYYVGVDTNGGKYDYGTYTFDLRLKSLLADGESCIDVAPQNPPTCVDVSDCPVLLPPYVPYSDCIGGLCRKSEDLDCNSGHCQNGYCCDHGDCCPGGAWTPWGTDDDPDAIKTDADWISAQAVCPAQYRGPQVCDADAPAGEFLNDCQGHREDANCVNHICEKDQVHDDTACDNSVEANTCNLFVSTYCGDYGPIPPRAQWEPVCLTTCSNDFDCDAPAHCDPSTGATVPDDGVSDVCIPDWADGSECNENSDCISNHCQNGYCCDHGDCCPSNDPTGALECPASYTTSPACHDTAGCEGDRKDPICSSFICGDVLVDDDCACEGALSDNCGLFIPVFCPAAGSAPDPDAPAGSCTQSPYPVTGPGQNVFQAEDPTCLTSCLDGGAENDALCDDIAHCDPCTEVNGGCSQDDVDNGEVKCQADLPYGYPCNEDGDCKNFSDDSLPGHCQNGYCCLTGDCCAINLGSGTANPDVCPTKASQTGYWSPSVCDNQSTCQGHRVDASCTADFTCGSQDVDDDTGCGAGLEAKQCGYYVSVFCDGTADQTDPPCPTNCDEDVECDPDAHCDPAPALSGCDEPECAPAEGTPQADCTYNTGEWLCKYDADNHPPAADAPPGSGTMTCQPDLPNDWACNEATDCMGVTSTCQLHFCCNVGDCCRGCKVTGYTPTIGGGGTDDEDKSSTLDCAANPGSPCYVQSIWGQLSAGTGRSEGAANIIDHGNLPNASEPLGGPSCSPSDADCEALP